MQMRIGCVDFVSNTFFPVIAAEELGFFKAEGLDAHVELVRAPVALAALRNGELDAVAISAHSVLRSFPRWEGAKLLVTVAQGLPWLLIIRSDLSAKSGDMNALRGLRIAAANDPALVLGRVLVESGLQPQKDVQIIELPGGEGPNINYGVFAAEALDAGRIDGFWANAMGGEVSIQRGIGKIHLDVRRDNRFAAVRHFTFATIVTTEALIERNHDRVAAAVRAIVKTHQALRADSSKATEVGKRRFPSYAAELIATIVDRDLPYYDPAISNEAIEGLNRFTQSVDLSTEPVPYERIVAARYCDLWRQ
jgi:NitT/TauT family transport system substrate-binding protein